MMLPGLEDRDFFPSLVRVEIEQLACCEPSGIGLSMTHWSTRSLTKIAMRCLRNYTAERQDIEMLNRFMECKM